MRRLLACAAMLAAGAASAQTRWQMPTPYAPQNFHTVNVQRRSQINPIE